MARYHQGKFKPKNPDRYKGDPKDIVYRSSWELRFFRYCDTHPGIKWWGSETVVVPYVHPEDGKIHRYFPDIVLKKKTGEVLMIEIKPYKETIPPKKENGLTKSGRPKKSFLREVRTFAINSSKWSAAEEYCKDRGWKFMKMTEKELGMVK